MARKFFNQKVKRSKKKNNQRLLLIIAIASLIILVLAILISVKIVNNNKLKKATIKLREVTAVEVNTELPDKTLFFEELQNVKESDIKTNFKKADIKTVGKYNVTLKIYGKKFKTILEVVDTKSPELEVKDVTISVGDSYKPEDFVKSCTDNSKKDCIVEFYDMSINESGTPIDYSNFKDEGNYTVQIIAKDESGNATANMSANLTIGKKTDKPKVCKYGNNEYDNKTYILSVDVTENGCALSLDLYKDANVLAPARKKVNDEETKIKKEFSKINVNAKEINFSSIINPVLNTAGDGVVGYTIAIEVSVDRNGQKEILASYYLNQNGSRTYTINKYNLK